MTTVAPQLELVARQRRPDDKTNRNPARRRVQPSTQTRPTALGQLAKRAVQSTHHHLLRGPDAQPQYAARDAVRSKTSTQTVKGRRVIDPAKPLLTILKHITGPSEPKLNPKGALPRPRKPLGPLLGDRFRLASKTCVVVLVFPLSVGQPFVPVSNQIKKRPPAKNLLDAFQTRAAAQAIGRATRPPRLRMKARRTGVLAACIVAVVIASAVAQRPYDGLGVGPSNMGSANRPLQVP